MSVFTALNNTETHSITSHYHSYWLPVMILTAAGKMAFRYNGARIIYAIFTDVENFEAGFDIVGVGTKTRKQNIRFTLQHFTNNSKTQTTEMETQPTKMLFRPTFDIYAKITLFLAQGVRCYDTVDS